LVQFYSTRRGFLFNCAKFIIPYQSSKQMLGYSSANFSFQN
jgi:hypothetical protein